MIITRSPLRITLGGGGTDLPSYYRDHCGFLIAGAIDKYVYITLHETFEQELIIKYSKMERVRTGEQVEHPIVREALRIAGITTPHLEITSMADIPAGTGLGSSGSFATALLKALHTHQKSIIHPRELAEEACKIEIDILGEPIGKQDQYIAAFGGVTCFRYNNDESVDAWPLKVGRETLYRLEENLLLFFTGYSRSASEVLREQKSKTVSRDPEMISNLHFVKELGIESEKILEAGDLKSFAQLMNTHWQYKKRRSGGMTNPKIEEWYELALAHGAIGGKLIGAGGGGFLMFYAEEKDALRRCLKSEGLHEVRFRFDYEGTKVVVQS